MFSELPDTSDASSGSSPLAPINSLLPKELLLRVFSFLDVVSLCRSAGRFTEKTLSRPQFHKAMVANEVGLSAVQIDSLFVALTPDAQSPLDIRGW